MCQLDANALLAVANSHGRICLKPKPWVKLWELISDTHQKGTNIALPLILDGWYCSSDHEKNARFTEHLKWGIDHGKINEISALFDALAINDWYYGER